MNEDMAKKEPIEEEPSFISRMRTESYELGVKIEKASLFLIKETEARKRLGHNNILDTFEFEYLEKQLKAMKEYHDILMTRIVYEGEDD